MFEKNCQSFLPRQFYLAVPAVILICIDEKLLDGCRSIRCPSLVMRDFIYVDFITLKAPKLENSTILFPGYISLIREMCVVSHLMLTVTVILGGCHITNFQKVVHAVLEMPEVYFQLDSDL